MKCVPSLKAMNGCANRRRRPRWCPYSDLTVYSGLACFPRRLRHGCSVSDTGSRPASATASSALCSSFRTQHTLRGAHLPG